jgi:hypothetical protein
MERAKGGALLALVVTIDTAVAGLRERDFHNGRKLLTRKRSRCCHASSSARAG